ncbi:tRNA A58 N-methylase Trm61 [Paenibacillus sp. W4I10]|nr:tRNA A58 N-methylase Trm61 [Paenibacillus sp. W4I10]
MTLDAVGHPVHTKVWAGCFFCGFLEVVQKVHFSVLKNGLFELEIIEVHFRKLPELDFFCEEEGSTWKEQNIC